MPYLGKRTLPQFGEAPRQCEVQRTLTSLCSAYRGWEGTHLQRSKETKRNETRHLERDDSKW